MTNAEIIDCYIAAFRAANKDAAPTISYRNGWFVFERWADNHCFVMGRYRKAEIIAMTEVLLKRAAEQENSDER